MPKMIHDHKSMLLRGVKMPTPALTRSDIEVLRGKASRGGYGGGGRGGRYDPGGHHQFRPAGRGRGQHFGQSHHHQSDSYRHGDSGPPPHHYSRGRGGWQPPHPGSAGFGRGIPPPPPAHQGGWAPRGHQGGYNHHQTPNYPPRDNQHYNGGWNGRR